MRFLRLGRRRRPWPCWRPSIAMTLPRAAATFTAAAPRTRAAPPLLFWPPNAGRAARRGPQATGRLRHGRRRRRARG
jgi:hypothetical protein